MTETVVTDEFMLEMRAKTRAYTLVLINKGPEWETPDRDSIIWEHGRRNHVLRLEKVLAIVGPIPDDSPLAGMYIFDRTPPEVEKIMSGDPAVQAGVFVFEVHPLIGLPGDLLPSTMEGLAAVAGQPDTTLDATKLPRIEPLRYEDADEQTQARWDEMRRARRPGEPGPDTEHVVFRTFMHHPELMAVHSPFVQYVKNSTNLPVRHRELAILRGAWLGGVDVQFVIHTEIGLDSGLTPDEIDRIPAGPGAPGWSDDDAAVLRAVDELHSSCRVGDDTWAALARQYTRRQLIEFLLLVGNYRTLAYVQNSVGIRPPTGTSPNLPANRFLFPDS
jgi:alkylhydroperoxidase family enzyme